MEQQFATAVHTIAARAGAADCATAAHSCRTFSSPPASTAACILCPSLHSTVHTAAVFSKPSSMESFLALYTRISKDDIRNNRENVAEKLGFLGRAIHGSNPRVWLQEVRQHIGETSDFAAATL